MKNLDTSYDKNKKKKLKTLFFQQLAMEFGVAIPGLVVGITFATALIKADFVFFSSVNFLVIVQWTFHVKNGWTSFYVTFEFPFAFIMWENVAFKGLFPYIFLMANVTLERFWGWRLNRNRLDWTGLGGTGWINRNRLDWTGLGRTLWINRNRLDFIGLGWNLRINRNRLDFLRLGRNTFIIAFFCFCEYWLFYLDYWGDEQYFIFLRFVNYYLFDLFSGIFNCDHIVHFFNNRVSASGSGSRDGRNTLIWKK